MPHFLHNSWLKKGGSGFIMIRQMEKSNNRPKVPVLSCVFSLVFTSEFRQEKKWDNFLKRRPWLGSSYFKEKKKPAS